MAECNFSGMAGVDGSTSAEPRRGGACKEEWAGGMPGVARSKNRFSFLMRVLAAGLGWLEGCSPLCSVAWRER